MFCVIAFRNIYLWIMFDRLVLGESDSVSSGRLKWTTDQTILRTLKRSPAFDCIQ